MVTISQALTLIGSDTENQKANLMLDLQAANPGLIP